MRWIRKGEWRELKKLERNPWRESMESDVPTVITTKFKTVLHPKKKYIKYK